MMNSREMKEMLFNKLQAENTYFQKSDISIRRVRAGYQIVIKEYEHIKFRIEEETDEYFGYVIWLRRNREIIDMFENKEGYDYRSALLYLGYHIASRF